LIILLKPREAWFQKPVLIFFGFQISENETLVARRRKHFRAFLFLLNFLKEGF